MVVLLTGELGAGKTAFARGVARGLEVTGPVTSPSFTLVEEHQGRIPLYHLDVYRLNAPDELLDIGYEVRIRPRHLPDRMGRLGTGILPPDHLK